MEPTDEEEQTAKIIGNAVSYVVNEVLLLIQFETTLEKPLPSLWTPQTESTVTGQLSKAVEHMGGPPDAIVLSVDEKPPIFDSYPVAALQEAISVFHRARKSVLRANLFMAGSALIESQPDLMHMPDDPKITGMFVRSAGAAFWEHAETAYIRLTAYWDRIGQVLDFAFFNIRQYERDGFSAVMDRIHSNEIPINHGLAQSGTWKHLRAFQTSERDDGLKWLLRRRNIVVHSLHLHPIPPTEEDVFKYQYNHLEASHRDRLKPRTPEEEIMLLRGHLEAAANLFLAVLPVLMKSPQKSRKRF